MTLMYCELVALGAAAAVVVACAWCLYEDWRDDE